MGRHSPALIPALALTAALLGLLPVGPAGAAQAPQVLRASTTPCRLGLIALTFDDGPSRSVTPHLVRTLLELKVPATFFMIGSRVHTAPDIARLVQKSGFQIGNHTWSHPELTHRSDAEIKQEIGATAAEFKKHFVTPSRLMRPPYGDINDRVRHDIHDLGLHPVLWNNDSRDWSGGTSMQIAHRILVALRPHQTNLVLQHDGVDNSPASVAAVPVVVRAARNQGYCFTNLGPTGEPAGRASVPVSHVAGVVARSGGGGAAGHPPARRVAAVQRVDRGRRMTTNLVRFGVPGVLRQASPDAKFRVLFGVLSGPVVPRGHYLAQIGAGKH